MPFVMAHQLEPGDTIVERKDDDAKIKSIPVKKVSLSTDSCRGIHVNDNMCYDRYAAVRIQK